MRNIMLLGSSLNFGGAERVIANLAQNIDTSRFSVTVCHLKEGGVVAQELASRAVRVIAVPRSTGRPRRYLSFIDLGKIVDELCIDLIHTHTTYGLSDATLGRLFWRRAPRLVHTFHFGNYPQYPRRYRHIEFVCARRADRLVAVGYEQRNRIRKTYRLSENRICTVVNGVESPAAAPDPSWKGRLSRPGQVVVGTICTFIEQKGLPDLVEVAKRVCSEQPWVVFVIVGDGPMRETLMQACVAAGLKDRVLFAGWKPVAGASMLPLFDIFIQTSRWEAMSMVVLEAMAAAKPVVVTDVGDNRHVVQTGVNGLVVPPGDIDGLRSAVTSLVVQPEKRQAFGMAGRARYDERYTARAMARSYETIYTECLNAE